MTKPVVHCLLIDDDTDDQEIFVMALESTGLEVICEKANDGNKGLDKLKNMDPLPDFVFLDLNMPNKDGKSCLRDIRSNTAFSEVPVIIYSTSSYTGDINETLRNGATGFITKPANIKLLSDMLMRIFSGTYSFDRPASA